MRKWLFLLAALHLAATAVSAETPQSNDTVQATASYAQSKEGFSAQLNAIIQFYRAGDEKNGRRLLDQFRLPNSEEWFSEHLGPAQSTELVARYDRLFPNFAESLEKTIETVVATHQAELISELGEGNGEKPSVLRPGVKPSGIVSVKEVLLSYGQFAIQLKKKRSVSWADTFSYEDGMFRFVGFGAWPFWVWQEGSEGGAPQGGHFSQLPILISQVQPIYPPSAKALEHAGVVTIRARIDKEGRVKNADIVEGDALLTQAALDAVRQWRYKPGTLGGAPIEVEIVVKVVFAQR